MSIPGLNSYNPASYKAPASHSNAGTSQPNAWDKAAQDFMNLMKQSPMERWMDQWLKSHNLTKEDLEKMPAEQRHALMREMAQDIARDIKEKIIEGKKGLLTDVYA